MSTNNAALTGVQLSTMRTYVVVSLVGFFLESLLCGAFTVVFGAGVWAMSTGKLQYRRSSRDTLLFAASAAMYALAIAHISIDAHVIVASGILRGADLKSLSSSLSTFNSVGVANFGFLKLTIYIIQTLIADGFMIYRAFVVWNSSWRAVFIPFALLIGAAALGIFVVVSETMSTMPLPKLHACTRAYFLMTLATNVIATLLVMKPLFGWRRSARAYRPKGSQLRTVRWRVMESILQSAAIFTISSLVFTVTQFVNVFGYSFSHYFFPPTIGIVFTLTVGRICLSAAQGAPDIPRRSVHELSLHGYPYGAGGHQRSHSCPSLPVADVDIEAGEVPESCCSHGSGRGTAMGTRIAIRVEVSTLRTSEGLEEHASLTGSTVSSYRGREDEKASENTLTAPGEVLHIAPDSGYD